MSGDGQVVLKAGGALVHRVLQTGEKLKVVPGALVCFSVNVQYDVTMLRGFANIFFGGESLFLVTLTGPGTVYLQSMSFDMLVMEINKRLPQRDPGDTQQDREQTARQRAIQTRGQRTDSQTDREPYRHVSQARRQTRRQSGNRTLGDWEQLQTTLIVASVIDKKMLSTINKTAQSGSLFPASTRCIQQ
jgi:hypothetical protein